MLYGFYEFHKNQPPAFFGEFLGNIILCQMDPFPVGGHIYLFSLFFTPEIVHTIVEDTNRYAAQCLEGKPTTWATTEEELRAYFGFYIYMGLVREPEIRDYWSNDDTFHYSPVAGRISRHRFEEISRCLQTGIDNRQLPARGTPGHHRLQRVKPVIDAIRNRFSAVYNPGVNISVDEAMVPFKGKLATEQVTCTIYTCTHNYCGGYKTNTPILITILNTLP